MRPSLAQEVADAARVLLPARAPMTTPTARIHLVRHGATRLNLERRYQGALDEGLSPDGTVQAAALGRRFASVPLALVVASGATRALETASAIVGQRRAQVPTVVDERWAEARHGTWEGLTYEEVVARWPDEARARYEDPLDGRSAGGETLREVAARVLEAWAELLARARGDVVVVTHATPVRVVLAAVHGEPLADAWRIAVAPGSVATVEVNDGRVAIADDDAAAVR